MCVSVFVWACVHVFLHELVCACAYVLYVCCHNRQGKNSFPHLCACGYHPNPVKAGKFNDQQEMHLLHVYVSTYS